ncbi:bacteriohemerythrin [Candidatus Magnetaquicoccus inordinatus]|uniref:bacteriohemerythrin n=1 Tax=Candidatus Magnetaquicoccus inordinatus TaxID=2496818 RepID=UPI00102BF6EA|nr:bacteriohemerythrin [Candidatus Magnetaquicoccus inordinatus]
MRIVMMSIRTKMMMAMFLPGVMLLSMSVLSMLVNDRNMEMIFLWLQVGIGLWMLAMGVLFIRFALGSLRDIQQVVQRMAGGDFTGRMPMPIGHDESTSDEIVQLGVQLNIMAGKVAGVMNVVTQHSGGVVACAGEIMKIRDLVGSDAGNSLHVVEEVTSQNRVLAQEIEGVKGAIAMASRNIETISHSSMEVADNISHIASGTEQASINIGSMAAAAEQINSNINGVNRNLSNVDNAVKHVAVAVRDMTSALGEVRERCQSASEASSQTDKRVRDTQATMEKLSTAANEIGKFVKIIKNIADQTSLLALNASIEAAGAGEAGKSFAVVANEVKELSRQTEKATWMIREKTEDITKIASSVALANREIIASVNSINQANQIIAYAVDEQTSAIHGIADSMTKVSEGAEEVTRNAHELGEAAHNVSRAAAEAAIGTSEVARAASSVAVAASSVADESKRALTQAHAVSQSAEKTFAVSRAVAEQMAEAERTARAMRASAKQFDRMGQVLQAMSGALYATQMEVEIGAPMFNMRAAKGMYLEWQSKLEQAIAGRLVIGQEELEKIDRSEFSQWLQKGSKGSCTNSAMCKLMLKERDEVHSLIRQLVNSLQEKKGAKPEQLEAQLLEYVAARQRLFLSLEQIYEGVTDPNAKQKPFMVWNDRLNTGLRDVDSDHRKLMDMINQLHQAMKRGASKESVLEILKKLADYTVFHFKREEDYFDRTSYPERTPHKAEHKKLVDLAVEFIKRYDEGDFAIVIDLMSALRSWLVSHIMHSDQAYAPFLKEKGIR